MNYNTRAILTLLISILMYAGLFTLVGLGVSRVTLSGSRAGLGRTFFFTALVTYTLVLFLAALTFNLVN
jgi:hypothetical protein